MPPLLAVHLFFLSLGVTHRNHNTKISDPKNHSETGPLNQRLFTTPLGSGKKKYPKAKCEFGNILRNPRKKKQKQTNKKKNKKKHKTHTHTISCHFTSLLFFSSLCSPRAMKKKTTWKSGFFLVSQKREVEFPSVCCLLLFVCIVCWVRNARQKNK